LELPLLSGLVLRVGSNVKVKEISMRSKFAIPAVVIASLCGATVVASAQTNPGGGTRATGYPTAEKKTNDVSDPLIRKLTSARAMKNRSPGVTTGTSIGPRAPATGAPTSSQQGVGTNGGWHIKNEKELCSSLPGGYLKKPAPFLFEATRIDGVRMKADGVRMKAAASVLIGAAARNKIPNTHDILLDVKLFDARTIAVRASRDQA
jgi:hypothetical protein